MIPYYFGAIGWEDLAVGWILAVLEKLSIIQMTRKNVPKPDIVQSVVPVVHGDMARRYPSLSVLIFLDFCPASSQPLHQNLPEIWSHAA